MVECDRCGIVMGVLRQGSSVLAGLVVVCVKCEEPARCLHTDLQPRPGYRPPRKHQICPFCKATVPPHFFSP